MPRSWRNKTGHFHGSDQTSLFFCAAPAWPSPLIFFFFDASFFLVPGDIAGNHGVGRALSPPSPRDFLIARCRFPSSAPALAGSSAGPLPEALGHVVLLLPVYAETRAPSPPLRAAPPGRTVVRRTPPPSLSSLRLFRMAKKCRAVCTP